VKTSKKPKMQKNRALVACLNAKILCFTDTRNAEKASDRFHSFQSLTALTVPLELSSNTKLLIEEWNPGAEKAYLQVIKSRWTILQIVKLVAQPGLGQIQLCKAKSKRLRKPMHSQFLNRQFNLAVQEGKLNPPTILKNDTKGSRSLGSPCKCHC